MIVFEHNDLIMIWYALLDDQQSYEKGTKEWLRREELILRLEKHLNITRMVDKPGVERIKGQTKDD
jgi:hypothetical protein